MYYFLKIYICLYFIVSWLCRRYLRHICKVTHTHKLSKERLQLIISVVCSWYPRLIIFSQIVKYYKLYTEIYPALKAEFAKLAKM